MKENRQDEDDENFSSPPDDSMSYHSFTEEGDTALNSRDNVDSSITQKSETNLLPTEIQTGKLIEKGLFFNKDMNLDSFNIRKFNLDTD